MNFYVHKKTSIFFYLLFTLLSFSSFAQHYEITGKVVSQHGPIIGGVVLIEGSSNATTTNASGFFTIAGISKGTYELHLSHKGFITKHISINVQGNTNAGTIELQEDYFRLDNITVTNTRNQILGKEAPVVCNLIDDKILKATQSVTLLEGLSFQPALRIENNCQNCGFSGLRMNGLEATYSQVLIDGRPIFNSLQGVYGLEQIPANMIERVEIIRSGGSALYGSSAIAGTVNVITREPEENNFYVNTNLAWLNGKTPDQTFMIGGNMLTPNKKAGLSINAFNRNRTPWDANGDGFSEIGLMRSNSFQAKAYLKPTELSKITVNGFGIYEFRRGGNRFEYAYHEADITEATTHNILNGGITYEQLLKNTDHKFSTYFNYQSLHRDSYYGANRDPKAYGNSDDKSIVAGAQYSGKLGRLAGGTHTLVTGLEYTTNELKDNAPAYNRFIHQQSKMLACYAQDLWEIGNKLNILLGGRIDKHNFVNKAVISPRMNVLYKITPALQYRLGYARGFRAPQVFDEDLHVAQVGGQGVVVNSAANLQPEYSNAFSTSLDYTKYIENGLIGISVDAFYTTLKNVFVLEEVGKAPSGDLLMERRNGKAAQVMGITINPKMDYKNIVTIQLGFTIQKSEHNTPVRWSKTITNDNKRFLRTPDQYGYYLLGINLTKHFSLNFTGVYTGSMLAQHYKGYINADRLETTPSFLENNAKAAYTFDVMQHFKLSLYAGIQNYTNAYQKDFDLGKERDARYNYGPSRPRTIFAGLKAEF